MCVAACLPPPPPSPAPPHPGTKADPVLLVYVQATCDTLAAMPTLLPLIHQLEAVSSGSTIGPLAETLLEELSEGGSPPVGGSIRGLRAATKAAMREKAMARRKAMLAALKMPQQTAPASTSTPTTASSTAGPSREVSTTNAPASSSTGPGVAQGQEAEAVIDEERRGLVCMVCKEGYASQPNELLGAYCYCMKLHPGEALGAVPELWNGPRVSGSRQAGVQVCIVTHH